MAESISPPSHGSLTLALWAFLLATGLTGVGCGSTAPLGTDSNKPYRWEELPHHPAFAWHRHKADSALVHIQIPAHEPLHLRENRNLPFRFSLEIDLTIQPLELPESDSAAAFSPSRHLYRWQGEADSAQTQLQAWFAFPLGQGRYRISHTIRDLHRGSAVSGAVLMDAWSEDAPVRALAFDADSGEPAWNLDLPSGRTVGLLIPPDLSDLNWEYTFLPPVDTFPSAPFLDRRPFEMRFPETLARRTPIPADTGSLALPPGNWSGWSVMSWDGKPGIHQWSAEGSQRKIVLPARRPHFPAMRDLDEMMKATRYIATRSEYKAMMEARDPKRALDAFWLQFAGNPEDARELIRTYYGRVRDANVHFSGLKEGWRTDRGMVHIVLGHPDQTRSDRYGETWVYGEEGDINALIFRFAARPSGDDFNVLELERYPGFRSPWEAMISSWRRGKIRRR